MSRDTSKSSYKELINVSPLALDDPVYNQRPPDTFSVEQSSEVEKWYQGIADSLNAYRATYR